MKRIACTLALGLLAPACADDATPAPTGPTVTVETFNVGLAGAFIPFEPQRRAAVGPALAQNPSDIVCLQEVWREEDKDAIATAVRGTFPHVARARHNLDTRADVELEPGCAVPAAPTTPPCGSMELRATLDAGLRCLAANCSTMPGSEMGMTTSTGCAAMRCVTEVGGLFGSPDALRCYGCLATALPTDSIASIRALCTGNVNAGLAFGGQSGVMILSKHPLTDVQTLVIPGTWNRRVITRATATLPGNRRVAVYCNHLTPEFSGLTYPYTGRYGCNQTTREGWATEQLAQARRLARFVTETAGTTPAVVLGDFNTGPMSEGIAAEAVATYDFLRMQFTPAVPAGYQPRCTFCRDNFLTGASSDVWIDHIFLKNFPQSATRSLARTYTEASVAVPMAPNRVSVSDHYGLRAVLSL